MASVSMIHTTACSVKLAGSASESELVCRCGPVSVDCQGCITDICTQPDEYWVPWLHGVDKPQASIQAIEFCY